MIAAARSAAYVGRPDWSETTVSSRFPASAAPSIVSTKFAPPAPYTHDVRTTRTSAPEASASSSPHRFPLPYALTGSTASVSRYGRVPRPLKT